MTCPQSPTEGQLLNNRAACHLKTGNMRGVLQDTAAAIHTCTFLTLLQPEGGETVSHRHVVQRLSSFDTFSKACMR